MGSKSADSVKVGGNGDVRPDKQVYYGLNSIKLDIINGPLFYGLHKRNWKLCQKDFQSTNYKNMYIYI